ncbi:hypothetical protein DIS24_g11027 [Lasiodiplodia hormozganensis]|uniref:Uncharacterized protein n=1 Tax=Lasiodiplodia hormozganensis TaxID=869390 RepID=A0AA39X2J9_9PEZI|nr:hypothetical protein DIS24_g11027 [Lasiodiplodia hormozganensis]
MHYIKISNDDWEEKGRELKQLRELLERKELDAVRIRNNRLLARVQKLEADFERLYDFCERTLHTARQRVKHRKCTVRWLRWKLSCLAAGEWDDPQQQ